MSKQTLEEKIIEHANDMCVKYFRDFEWYDKNNPLTTLHEALAVLIDDAFQGEDFDYEEISVFLKNKFKGV